MSYNIDSTTELVLDAYMDMDDVADLLDNHEDELPECCFLHEMRKQLSDARSVKLTCQCGHKNAKGSKFCNDCGSKLPRSKPGNRLRLPNLWWYGEGSGSTFDFFKEHVAPKIMGEVQVIFTWEGGDSFSGFAIKDGKAHDCDVVQALKLPKDW